MLRFLAQYKEQGVKELREFGNVIPPARRCHLPEKKLNKKKIIEMLAQQTYPHSKRTSRIVNGLTFKAVLAQPTTH